METISQVTVRSEQILEAAARRSAVLQARLSDVAADEEACQTVTIFGYKLRVSLTRYDRLKFAFQRGRLFSMSDRIELLAQMARQSANGLVLLADSDFALLEL